MASGISTLINVSNLDKSVEFYKGLGLKAGVRREGDMVWGEVRSGDQMLMLADKNQGPDAGDPWLAGELGKGVLLNVGVANAKRTFDKAQALRASVDRPLQDQPWGGQGFMISDPDGYVLMISDADWEEADEPARAAKRKPAKRAKTARTKTRKGGAKAKRATKRRR